MSAIYGLIDGNTMELRYVGQTTRSPDERLKAHMANGAVHLRSWLRKTKANVIVLERDPEDLNGAEIRWIREMRERGADLINVSPGGESGPLGYRHTKAARAKITAAQLGRQLLPEHRAKLSAVRKGIVYSEETKTRIGLAKRGQVPWNKGLTGVQVSPYKGKQLSEEHCVKLRAARVGMKLSDTHRANISAGLLRAWREGKRRGRGLS